MKFPKDSFYTNFVGVWRSKDVEITNELIKDELAWLIANKRKEVIAMLKEVGITIDNKAKDEKIIDAVLDNRDNVRLHTGIAYLITKRHEPEMEKFSGLLTDEDAPSSGSSSSSDNETGGLGSIFGSMNPVSAVANAISSVFGFAQSAKEAKAQKEHDRAELIQSVMAYKTAKAGGGGSNTTLYIILGLVVVGGLIAAYFLVNKAKPKPVA